LSARPISRPSQEKLSACNANGRFLLVPLFIATISFKWIGYTAMPRLIGWYQARFALEILPESADRKAADFEKPPISISILSYLPVYGFTIIILGNARLDLP
jgi:hypothetical protein